MGYVRYWQDADGVLRSAVAREWSAAGTCRIARNRSTATVEMRLTTEGDEIALTVAWERQPPDEDRRNAICWRHHDPEGGRWSVEYGYDGRFWCLFGPDGSPWGDVLWSTISMSLIKATEVIARRIAYYKDWERRA